MSSDPTPIARHRLWLTAVLAAAVLSACAWPRASVAPEAAPSPARTGLANPAAVACVQAGGRLQIERSADGERGICLLEKTTNFGEGLGKVLAHADFLSALTGEEENSGERHGVRERW